MLLDTLLLFDMLAQCISSPVQNTFSTRHILDPSKFTSKRNYKEVLLYFLHYFTIIY